MPVASAGMSELVAAVEHARALFDAGDIKLARKISSVAYDEAKAAANSAERVKASRALVDKARRMQAEALKIESACDIAMADAVDEAQAKGQISLRGGRPETVQSSDRFTLEDVGIDKRRLHDARNLRNKVLSEPDYVDRIVEARLAQGLEPTRASLRHAVGTRTATKDDRGDDLYETPIEAMRTLLALESFALNIVEPSVGRGAILRPLEAAGYEVAISDIIDRGIVTQHGECQGVGNFMRSVAEGGGWDIVTNPPYGPANAYAAHALREHRPRKMALLLNLNFICGFENPDRRFVMDECPPSRVYVFTRRLPMMHRDGWDGPKASSQMNTAWLVWERNDDGTYGSGPPHLIRVDWNDYVDADPLSPGLGGYVDPIRFADAEEDFTRTTPRKTLDERASEAREMAEQWARGQDGFTRRDLRREIGVRDSVAEALIIEMMDRGLIGLPDNDGVHMVLAAKCEAA
ncbi:MULTISPECIES: hypothetical protein [unclassified Shinella]|uniref:hypothetical protein n=1 Tax=unclassified Shinella TaxID=2643062 RepID=UPI00234EA199|nr:MULTISPECIES: hypothetical protein [unclassified Shinella]MCO5153362.1 hypothetical protein [Shinella sp.]MDC7260541.1 hypothetical protein [Shinella sp. HY16]MDC7267436.1 hypothetical protein [Shinella sp. YZ44]